MSFLTPESRGSDALLSPPLKSQKGFTLVELLVAILLMTVGIFAVIAMQTTSMKANSIAMKLSVATSLAQEALEDILSWPPNTPNLLKMVKDEPYDLNPADSTVDTVTIPGAGTYTATYDTTLGPAPGIPEGITGVTVTVTGGGRTVKVTGFKRTA